MVRLTRYNLLAGVCVALACALPLSTALPHGDVAPQPVNTDGLPDVGEEWLEENPYREPGTAVWRTAVEVGASGYNQNCARCHGLGAVSGGLAPDLRYLEANIDGDEWYIERYVNGYTQNGITKMPAFGDLLGQKAAWAIRTYIETRPDEGALDAHTNRLREIRDQISTWAKGGNADSAKLDSIRKELDEIGKNVETGSGAPMADSIASAASRMLAQDTKDLKQVAEILTIGLSAAQ